MSDGHADLVQWIEAHGRPVMLYARQWLDNHSTADIVQDAFLKLMQQPTRPNDVRAWLFRTVRNAALNELRRQRTREQHASAVANHRPPWFVARADDQLDAQAAQTALKQLPTSQSELIVMRIWGQMTFEQMAEVTGESVSTVHTHYQAAIEALRKKMQC